MIEIKYFSNKMLFLSTTYFTLIVIISICNAADGLSNSLFDYVSNLRWGGSASMMPLLLGALPVLAIVLPLLMDRMERDMIVLRLRQKRSLFYQHFLFSILISALFTCLMAFLGIIAAFIETGHVQNLWDTEQGSLYFLLDNKEFFPIYTPHVSSIKAWIYILGTRFLAILFIATCVIFLKTFLKKNIYVFFISLIFLGTDGLFLERFSLFIGRVRIEMETWIKWEDQLFNLVYFVFGILALLLICLKTYDKIEFYQ